MFEIWYAISRGGVPLRADVYGHARASRVWDALSAAGFHMMNQRPACLSRIPVWDAFSRKERNAIRAYHNGTISYEYALRYLRVRGMTDRDARACLDESAYEPDCDLDEGEV